MSMKLIKNFSRKLGVYRQARWVNRHLFDRRELNEEKSSLSLYRQVINPGDLVFDVGANYGEKSRVFLELGAKVIAFEPQPDCRLELQDRCGNGDLLVVQKALGAEEGSTKLWVHPKRGSSSLLENWREGTENAIDVDVSTLDVMIKSFGRPSFIKIDVEGFEWEVLQGLSCPIPCMSLEYHRKPENIESTFACLRYLSTLAPEGLQINFTGDFPMKWEFAEWHSLENFIEVFVDSISDRQDLWYGDIFVKMKDLPSV